MAEIVIGDPVDPCPECVQGKHTNCCTLTWDNVKDEAVECPCFATDRIKHLVLS